MAGSIVFIHGTGVRLKNYVPAFRKAEMKAKDFGIAHQWQECGWGDALGAVFEGASLPQSQELDKLDEEDHRQWAYLYDDPLSNLRPLTIPPAAGVADLGMHGEEPRAELVWAKIKKYTPSPKVKALLERAALDEFWPDAFADILQKSTVPAECYAVCGADTAEVSMELARAIVAAAVIRARRAGFVIPGRQLRARLVEQLREDWGEKVFALTDRLGDLFAKLPTRIIRENRDVWSDKIAFVIGDILLYQSKGAAIRQAIRKAVEDAKPPVYLLAHSLGGIACFDLLAMANPPKVKGLITFGSQAPLLYELGALSSLQPPQQPKAFPPWLNLYDCNDFLSYCGERLFSGMKDKEIASGRPFPHAHSWYLETDAAWEAIRDFVK